MKTILYYNKDYINRTNKLFQYSTRFVEVGINLATGMTVTNDFKMSLMMKSFS